MGQGIFHHTLKNISVRYRKGILASLTAFMLAWGAVILVNSYPGELLDIFQLRRFFGLRGTTPAPENIVVVTITDEAFTQFATDSIRGEFPRIYTAKALERISSAAPRLLIIDARMRTETFDPAANDLLEHTLKSAPTVIWSGEVAKSPMYLLGTKDFKSVVRPSDERFRRAATMEIPMWLQDTHGVKLALTATSRPDAPRFDRVPLSRPLVELAHIDVPPVGPRDLINFYSTLKTVSLLDVLAFDQQTLWETFNGAFVLFGYGARDLYRGEEFNVPVAPGTMFGVEIHAIILANLLDKSWLRRMSPELHRVTVLLLVFVVSMAAMMLPRRKGLLIVFTVYTLFVVIAYQLFARYNIWLPGACSLIAVAVVNALLAEEMENRMLERVFWATLIGARVDKCFSGLREFLERYKKLER